MYPLLNEQGFINDFDRFEIYLKESLNSLSIKDQVPFLFTEPSIHNQEHWMKLVEVLFEKFKMNSIFISKSGVLSAFCCGKSTCLVMDMGHNHSSAIPVHEGYILNKCIKWEPKGGSQLTMRLKDVSIFLTLVDSLKEGWSKTSV